MKIGPKTINAAVTLLGELLASHEREIDEAYLKADNELSVGLSVKFKPIKDSAEVLIDAGINFVSERVKDSAETTVNENQMALFEAEKARSK